MSGNVSLHPLQANIGGKDLFDLRYQLGSRLVFQWAVFAFLIQPVQLSSFNNQGGIDLEVVGAKAAVGEKLLEDRQIDLGSGAGKAGHHMKSHLQPRLAESQIGCGGILHGMAPFHLIQDLVPGALHPQLHLGRS